MSSWDTVGVAMATQDKNALLDWCRDEMVRPSRLGAALFRMFRTWPRGQREEFYQKYGVTRLRRSDDAAS